MHWPTHLMWYVTFSDDRHFFPVLQCCAANQLFSYFVSNVKIMNNIILSKEEIHRSIYLWQVRVFPLGTVLSQLLFGGKGQYAGNRSMGFIHTTENLCHVTLDCEPFSVPLWGSGADSSHFTAATQSGALHQLDWKVDCLWRYHTHDRFFSKWVGCLPQWSSLSFWL